MSFRSTKRNLLIASDRFQTSALFVPKHLRRRPMRSNMLDLSSIFHRHRLVCVTFFCRSVVCHIILFRIIAGTARVRHAVSFVTGVLADQREVCALIPFRCPRHRLVNILFFSRLLVLHVILRFIAGPARSQRWSPTSRWSRTPDRREATLRRNRSFPHRWQPWRSTLEWIVSALKATSPEYWQQAIPNATPHTPV